VSSLLKLLEGVFEVLHGVVTQFKQKLNYVVGMLGGVHIDRVFFWIYGFYRCINRIGYFFGNRVYSQKFLLARVCKLYSLFFNYNQNDGLITNPIILI